MLAVKSFRTSSIVFLALSLMAVPTLTAQDRPAVSATDVKSSGSNSAPAALPPAPEAQKDAAPQGRRDHLLSTTRAPWLRSASP